MLQEKNNQNQQLLGEIQRKTEQLAILEQELAKKYEEVEKEQKEREAMDVYIKAMERQITVIQKQAYPLSYIIKIQEFERSQRMRETEVTRLTSELQKVQSQQNMVSIMQECWRYTLFHYDRS